MFDDFTDRCRQELRKWVDGGKISPELMDEIRMRTLVELADFARMYLPAISDELIWRNESDFRELKESVNQCGRCKWMPSMCPSSGITLTIKLLPSGLTVLTTQACAKKSIMGKAG
jgi:hypothetical protein